MRVIVLAALVVMAFAIACGEPERTAPPTAAPLVTATPLSRGLNAPNISSTNHLDITLIDVANLLEPQGFTSFQHKEGNIIYRAFTNASYSQLTYGVTYRTTSPSKIRRAAINMPIGERLSFVDQVTLAAFLLLIDLSIGDYDFDWIQELVTGNLLYKEFDKVIVQAEYSHNNRIGIAFSPKER